jgi:hypothetical protein
MKSIDRTLLTAILAVVYSATSVLACSVPVFRYALERWPADPYDVVVFHRGPLGPADRALVDDLAGHGTPDASAGDAGMETEESTPNLTVRTVDLDNDPAPEDLALWQAAGLSELPGIAVLYPPVAQLPTIAWTADLTAESVAQLIASPLRREIARRLLAGDTAVWLLLESGDSQKDGAAMAVLERELNISQKQLKLPEINPQDAAEYLSGSADQLKLRFSTLRLSRSDPAEQAFVSMLLGSELDLREFEEPMAFPIFGRGRVLYALIGAGINAEIVSTACQELVGPCTCQVKEQNPGVDLLMAVDWDRLIESTIDLDRELPPLPGLAGISAALPPDDAAEVERSEPTAGGLSPPISQPADNVPTGAGATVATPILRNTLMAGALGIVCVVAGSLWMLSRRREPLS